MYSPCVRSGCAAADARASLIVRVGAASGSSFVRADWLLTSLTFLLNYATFFCDQDNQQPALLKRDGYSIVLHRYARFFASERENASQVAFLSFLCYTERQRVLTSITRVSARVSYVRMSGLNEKSEKHSSNCGSTSVSLFMRSGASARAYNSDTMSQIHRGRCATVALSAGLEFAHA